MQPVSICEVQAPLHDDNAATAQTVAMMGAHVRDSWQDPEVRRCALEAVTSGSRPQCAADIAACVWAWCKWNIEFCTDQRHLAQLGLPVERELLISPKVMARNSRRKGDCDCFTMMINAMCAALGVTPLIKTFKCDADDRDMWSHVCAAVLLENGDVLPIDASHGKYFGWEVPAHDVYDSQLWDMQGRKVGPSKMQSKGLSGYVPYQGWDGLPAGSPSDCWRGVGSVAARRRGLNGIRRAKYGMGDLTDPLTQSQIDALVITPPDTGSTTTLDFSGGYAAAPGAPGSSTAITTPGGIPGYSTPINTTAAGSSSVGPSLSSLLNSLIGSGTALGTQILQQNRPLVVAPAPTTSLFGSSGSTVLILGLVGLAVVLVATKK